MLHRAKPNLHVHFVGSLDKLANAANNAADFPIIPTKPPGINLRPLAGTPTKVPSPVASLFESPETRLDFNNDFLDDYDESDLAELPNNFGPRLSNYPRRDSRLTFVENSVDYRDIFSKCYRNARRKTRALLEKKQTASPTYGDLADHRVSRIAESVPWEPLVQQWFALGSDFQNGVLDGTDYENLIPLLFLGFEEVILQVRSNTGAENVQFSPSAHYCK